MPAKYLTENRKYNLRLAREVFQSFSFFIISIFLGIILYKNETFHSFFQHLGNFELIGIVIAGGLFVITPTVAVSGALLLVFSEIYNIYLVCLIGAIGGTITDLLLFKFIRKGQDTFYIKFKNKLFIKYKESKFTLSLLGFLIILSPLPDELGVSLIGNVGIKYKTLILFCFVSNFISIYTLLIIGVVL